MRIGQVVTLVSPDGAYGGPVTVALRQLDELARLGHDVRLFAGVRGYNGPINSIGPIPLTTGRAIAVVPGLGFAGLSAPFMLQHLKRELQHLDVLHVHLARDLVTLPAARLGLSSGIPLVLQTHGMIDESSRLLARPIDAAFTLPALRNATRILYLTDTERSHLSNVCSALGALEHLPNGVARQDALCVEQQMNSASRVPEVLFSARLHHRKRPMSFALAAHSLQKEFPAVSFAMVGPDGGEGGAVRDFLMRNPDCHLSWNGALDPSKVISRLRRASIYVLPSVNEPFPMSVLEAASVGLPCVVGDTCGLARYIRNWNAGVIVNDSVDSLRLAISRLLKDPELRLQMGANARAMALREFDSADVALKLEAIYRQVAHSSSSAG